MSNPRKIARARQLILCSCRWIARCNFGVIPKKFEDGNDPLFREESALPQKPGAIRILEAIDGIAQQCGVAKIQNRVFIVAFSRRRSIWQELIQVGVANIGEDRIVVSWIYTGSGALQLRKQG